MTSAAAVASSSSDSGSTQASEVGLQLAGLLGGQRGGDPGPLGVDLLALAEADDEHPAGSLGVQQRRAS